MSLIWEMIHQNTLMNEQIHRGRDEGSNLRPGWSQMRLSQLCHNMVETFVSSFNYSVLVSFIKQVKSS